MSIQFILVNKPPLCDPSIKRYDRLKILLKFWLSPGLCSNWPSWYMAQKFFGQKLSHMKVKWTHKKNLGFAFSFWRNGDFRKKKIETLSAKTTNFWMTDFDDFCTFTIQNSKIFQNPLQNLYSKHPPRS